MQCCTQAIPVLPILLNPVTWMLVLAATTGVLSGRGKKK